MAHRGSSPSDLAWAVLAPLRWSCPPPCAHAAGPGLTSFHLSWRMLIFRASREVLALELSTVTGLSVQDWSALRPEQRLQLEPLLLGFPCGQSPRAGAGFVLGRSVGGGRGATRVSPSSAARGCARAGSLHRSSAVLRSGSPAAPASKRTCSAGALSEATASSSHRAASSLSELPRCMALRASAGASAAAAAAAPAPRPAGELPPLPSAPCPNPLP